MKKLLSFVVLMAMLLAACGGSSNSLAATVDGDEITVGDVEQLIDSGGEAVTREQFAQFLSFAIQWRVIRDAAAADYQIEVTEEEASAEADRIFEEFAADGQSREDFLAERGVSEQFLQDIAQQGVVDESIREILIERVPEPTTEEVDAERLAARAPLTNACVSHILVSEEDVATSIFDRLDDGEEFGEIAAEISEDPGSAENNGILPCGAPDQYVVPFRDAVLIAPVGEVYSEIVQSQFGYHVILVTDREDPAEGDLPDEATLVDAIKAQAVNQELEAWFLANLGEADVTVEEEYGTWQPNPPQVVPPQS